MEQGHPSGTQVICRETVTIFGVAFRDYVRRISRNCTKMPYGLGLRVPFASTGIVSKCQTNVLKDD